MTKVFLLMCAMVVALAACGSSAQEVIPTTSEPTQEVTQMPTQEPTTTAPPTTTTPPVTTTPPPTTAPPTTAPPMPPGHNSQPIYVEIEGVTRRIMPHGSLTTEHFLEDLDYMVYVLENNFALLDVAYWAHGIDYRVLAANARAEILAMEEPCEGLFHQIMHISFIPLFGTGHFDIFTTGRYNHMMRDFYGGYQGIKARQNLRLMHSPLAQRFYVYGPGQSVEISPAATAFIERIENTYPLPYNRIRGTGGSGRSPVTSTTIVEDDRIALITARGSMQDIAMSQFQIFDFYRQVRDFEHLIIDLRGNSGGDVNNFLNVLLRPHLAYAIDSPQAFVFFMEGPYARRFGDNLFIPTISSAHLTITQPYAPAYSILEDFDLPEFNMPDLARLDFGAPYNRIPPTIRPNTTMFNNEPAFGGEIWLLTDHRMVSAAQLSAWFAKETGFATLVGDVTGGVLGGPRTMGLMPNTGIIFYFDMFYITDSRGRPLEAGTIPHHFNHPGMDALETVLALIGN